MKNEHKANMGLNTAAKLQLLLIGCDTENERCVAIGCNLGLRNLAPVFEIPAFSCRQKAQVHRPKVGPIVGVIGRNCVQSLGGNLPHYWCHWEE